MLYFPHGTAMGVAAVCFALTAAAQEPPVALFDTGSTSADPLTADAVAQKQGWTRVPEGQKPGSFNGDAALVNTSVTLILRKGAPGAELYAGQAAGCVPRGRLVPLAGETKTVKVKSFKAVENAADAVGVDVVCQVDSKDAVVAFSLAPGLPAVKAQSRSGAEGLRFEAPCRLVVVPDFFADDILLDATSITVDRTEAPADNFLMFMQGKDEAIAIAIWDKSGREPELALAGQGPDRTFGSADVFFNQGSIWAAVLQEKNIWHAEEATAETAGKPVNLTWGPPFRAKWKANLPKSDGSNDSWEMMWHPQGRSLWATAIGRYTYPVWIDGPESNFVGHVEFGKPRKPEEARIGPMLVYPIDRMDKTPADKYTVTDLMRNCLGMGPCQYIMDVAGQTVHSRGLYTCAVYDILMPVFITGRQKEDRHFIEKTLMDGHTFVMAIRGRIEQFVKWGQDLRTWLDEQKKNKPEAKDFLEKMEKLSKVLDECYARKKGAATADVAGWIADYKPRIASELARDRGEQLVGQIRDGVGGPQDDLVGECRIAVKNLRQAAALAAARDPKVADLAREIRKRTHEVLRNKMGHEGR